MVSTFPFHLVLTYFFVLLTGVLALLGLVSFATTGRSGSYHQARKKSVKKGFLYLALAVITGAIAFGLLKPEGLVTVIGCTLAQIIILGITFGVAYLPISMPGKDGVTKQVIETHQRSRSEGKVRN